MWTPLKDSRRKRIYTTASTENPLANSTILRLYAQKQEVPEQFVYPEVQVLKKRLFEPRKQDRKVENAATVGRNYRREMVEYLNDKFQGRGRKIEEQKIKIKASKYTMEAHKPAVNASHISALFKQYMGAAREHSIKQMSEYNVGMVLQKMGFVKKVIDERQLVRAIWKGLKEPNLMDLFVFVSVVYFHPSQSRNPKIAKKQLCQTVQELFREEGYPFGSAFISKSYEIANSVILDTPTVLRMLVNRQRRPTGTSRSRESTRRRF